MRSPHAHARIGGIDKTAAETMPGVIGILDGEQLQGDGIGNLICGWAVNSKDGSPMKMGAWPALAVGSVRHVGQPVAVVVAETKAQARDAAEAVEIAYEELEAIVHPADAIKDGAPQLHPEAPGNLIFDWELGDKAATDAAFSNAAHVTKLHIVNNRLIPNAMEPRAALGHYDAADEHYTCWTTSQNPHVARLVMSAFYNVAPEHKLRVIAPDVGGGFGSKIYIYPEEIVCLWASKRTGVPVKWTSDRTEAFLTDCHGRDHVTTVEMALDADHKVLGLKVDTIANLGAYMSLFSSATPDLSLRDAAVRPIRYPCDPRQCAGGLHQHCARRCLSGRRPPRGDLCRRANHGDGSPRARHLAGGVASQEFHPVVPAPDAGDHELRHRRFRSDAGCRHAGRRRCRLRGASR